MCGRPQPPPPSIIRIFSFPTLNKLFIFSTNISLQFRKIVAIMNTNFEISHSVKCISFNIDICRTTRYIDSRISPLSLHTYACIGVFLKIYFLKIFDNKCECVNRQLDMNQVFTCRILLDHDTIVNHLQGVSFTMQSSLH